MAAAENLGPPDAVLERIGRLGATCVPNAAPVELI